MACFKKLVSQDLVTTPFVVNKDFTFNGIGEITSSSIDILWGVNYIDNETNPDAAYSAKTGYLDDSLYPGGEKPSRKTIFNSAKQLYYGNHISSSKSSGSYISSFANSVTSSAFFPTSGNVVNSSLSQVIVISIPKNLYGDYIQPGSFLFYPPIQEWGIRPYYDDKEGNLFYKRNDFITRKVGNIFYEQGIIVLTKPQLFPNGNFNLFTQYNLIKNHTLKFKSSYTIYESQIKCTIGSDEFNMSLNPSLLETSQSNPTGLLLTESVDLKLNETYKSFVTGSDFSPYVTTVGLYNEDQDLLAVAKLAQPLPTSPTTDTTILVNIDR
jgi:hypothetical protein